MTTVTKVPAELIRAGAAGSLLVLVGPGAAIASGLPGPRERLERLLARARSDPDTRRAALESAEGWFAEDGDETDKVWLLREVMGDGWVRAALAEIVSGAPSSPTPLHRALAALAGATFATTNVDGLLEEALRERTGRSPRVEAVAEGEGAVCIGAGDVLKLSGDAAKPETLALPGREDAMEGAAVPAPWRPRLAVLAKAPWEVLLVGYRARDPELRTVVEALRGGERREPGAFWLVAESAHARARAYALGLRAVSVPEGAEAVSWLRALSESIDGERSQGPAMLLRLLAPEEAGAGPIAEEMKQAQEAFAAHRYEEALAACERAVDAAERSAEGAARDGQAARTAAAARLNAGACLLDLGRSIEARSVLTRVADGEAALLPPSGRALLAEGLAQLGDAARARAALASGDGAEAPEDRGAIDAALQLIEVLEGRSPEGAPRSPLVALHAARLLVRKGALDRAATMLLPLVRSRDHVPPVLHALDALEEALERTVFEDNALEPVAVDRRAEIVGALEDGHRWLAGLALPDEVRRRWHVVRRTFLLLTKDGDPSGALHPHDSRPPAGEQAPAVPAALRGPSDLDRALELAARGEFDAALARLPASDHPWRAGYRRIELLVAAQRLAEALRDAIDLARKWPGRAPVEGLAAMLLHLANRHEALEHARSAFEALPGRGYRWLLGVCLRAHGDPAEAWAVLQPFRDEREPAVLVELAQAAEEACIEEATPLWERYLEARPDDAAARLALARVEARQHRLDRARELAWAAATGPGSEDMPPEALYFAAELQRAGGDLTELFRERIRTLADRLPAQGEPYRAALLSSIDLPGQAMPVDLDVLQQHGLLIEVHADEGETAVREDLDEQLQAQRDYRRGSLPFDALPTILRAPPIDLFLSALRGEAIALSLVARIDGEPTPPIAGGRILLGILELLLIHRLDLWTLLREALDASGRIVIFPDVAALLVDAADPQIAPEHGSAPPDGDASDAGRLRGALRQAMRQAIANGWMQVLPERPALTDLPALRPDRDSARNRRLVREPIQSSLAYRRALEQDSNLRLLTADFFTASAVVERAAAWLLWPTPEGAQDFRRRMQAQRVRVTSLPALVRALAPGPEGLQRRLDLAVLGFADALDASDVLWLAREHGTLDKPEPKRILDGLERLARRRGLNVDQAQVAKIYSATITNAWIGEDALPSDQAELLSTSLLTRVEAIDSTHRTAALDLLFGLLAETVAQVPDAAASADDPSAQFPSSSSPAAQLWSALATWVGPSGPRRAAYQRALRHVWLMLDVRARGDLGASREALALLLASQTREQRLGLERGIDAVAILSACWKTPLLEKISAQIVDPASGETRSASVEAILRHGARLLETGSGILLGDHRSRFVFPIEGGRYQVQVAPDSEALLLRITDEVALKRCARALAALQGPHDGAAYELLKAASEQPTDDLRRRYGRMTVGAPWRIVRETPTVLVSWRAARRGRLPRTVDDLRRMLSEPAQPLREDATLWQELDARLGLDGPWAARFDAWSLMAQAALVPGTLPAYLTMRKLAPASDVHYPALIADALSRMDNPRDHPAASLAEAAFFLRTAAAQKPFVRFAEGEVDLRERLPERLVALLRAVRQHVPAAAIRADAPTAVPGPLDAGTVEPLVRAATWQPGSICLADAEADLLRLSGRIVRGLAGGRELSTKNRLWLTYRLHQWVCAQIASLSADERVAWLEALPRAEPTLAPEDLLDPEGFDRDGCVDYRLITVLCALRHVDGVAMVSSQNPPPRSASSQQLEDELSDLASREWTEADRAVRALAEAFTAFDPPSVLDWDAAAVPDLALLTLLSLRKEAFFTLKPEARLRWLLAMPRRAADTGHVPWSLVANIFEALVAWPGRMSNEEARAFETWLRELQDPVVTGEPTDLEREVVRLNKSRRWRGLTALFVRGATAIEEEVRSLLLEHLTAEEAVEGFGQYLHGIARAEPERLAIEADRILAAVAAAGLDPVEFLPSIGQIILVADPRGIQAAADALRAIADRPPFRDNPRTRSLLGTVGLR